METRPVMFRQGDILLVSSELPEGATPVGTITTLAYGEKTGHHHRLERAAEAFASGGSTFINLNAITGLVHEEHAKIQVPAGTYKVVQQQEWQGDEAWAVAD